MSEQERERRRDAIAEQRRRLPDAPGVYVFHDADDRVVYVGKSKSIRKRVASHFSSRSTLGGSPDEVERIDFLVTDTEAEALIAEQQFIKRHRPVLNVKLRDDKSYPYIGISLDEEFPRVYFTRERHRPSRAYFGPYANARRVRETLELLGKLFQYRTCVGAEPGRRSGVRLDYYISVAGPPASATSMPRSTAATSTRSGASSPVAIATSSGTSRGRWTRRPRRRSSSALRCSATGSPPSAR